MIGILLHRQWFGLPVPAWYAFLFSARVPTMLDDSLHTIQTAPRQPSTVWHLNIGDHSCTLYSRQYLVPGGIGAPPRRCSPCGHSSLPHRRCGIPIGPHASFLHSASKHAVNNVHYIFNDTMFSGMHPACVRPWAKRKYIPIVRLECLPPSRTVCSLLPTYGGQGYCCLMIGNIIG